MLITITVRKRKTVFWNPRAGKRLPAAALQNEESAWAGTVSVTVILPCMFAGVLANTNPRSIAVMSGKGSPITELAIRTVQ